MIPDHIPSSSLCPNDLNSRRVKGVSAAMREHLRQAIQQDGPMPLDQFMETVLYHPTLGYYEADQDPVGLEGDFQTSVSLGPMLGKLLHHQAMTWKAGQTPWQWVECGAHHGQLAEDMLKARQAMAPSNPAHEMEYLIFEPSPKRQAIQKERLKAFEGQVSWVDSWTSLRDRFHQGIIFSNELLDAMPTRRLAWCKPRRQWVECCVTWKQDGLAWTHRPLEQPLRLNWLETSDQALLEQALPDDYLIEISPAAMTWWQEAARSLKRGYVVAIDYGFKGLEKFSPSRTGGTLRTYWRHRMGTDPFEEVGSRDLTAHVDFPALEKMGAEEGLNTIGLLPQESFMHQCLGSLLAAGEQIRPKETAVFRTLMHPEHFGHRFQVLIQQRT